MADNLLKNDAIFVPMVILTDDRQKPGLRQEGAHKIEEYIFDQICSKYGERPHFREYVFSEEDGAVIINTHEDSVDWLREVIRRYRERALSITDIKNSPQYTAKMKVYVPRLKEEAPFLTLLEAHNSGLQTENWRITSIDRVYYRESCATVTLLIDDAGREFLERNDFKLFFGLATLTFELLGRVKRSETTGKICVDDDGIQSQED